MNNREIHAWHFLTNDGRTGNGNLEVVVGQTLSLPNDKKTILCVQGFHGSERALDALRYAPGTVVERIVLWEDIQNDDDKHVARNRKCLWKADAARVLQAFAISEAEAALALIEEPDERAVNALLKVRQFLSGKIDIEELDAATNAAYASYAAHTARATPIDNVAYAAAAHTAASITNAAFAAHAAAASAHAVASASYSSYAAAYTAADARYTYCFFNAHAAERVRQNTTLTEMLMTLAQNEVR